MRSNLSFLFIFAAAFGLTTFACQTNSASVGNNASIAADPAATPKANTVVSGTANVTVISADKMPLAGTFYEAAKPGSPAVLLLHQYSSDRHSYDSFAKRLQAAGFNVLSIDGRGFGESVKTADGKTIGPSRTSESVKAMNGDVASAFEYLSKQKNVDPARIGIVGASYGSSLAIIYGAENKAVKAVALLSPGLNYFGNMPTEPAVKTYGNRPLYLLAAKDDDESVKAVAKLNAVVGERAKYEQTIHPSGGHGTALLKVGATEEIADFLSRNL